MSTQGLYARLPFQPLALRPVALLERLRKWFISCNETRAGSRRLHIAEKVSIGEKSFVSVVHIDGRRFLLASTQTNVSLITELSPEETFSAVVKCAVSASKQPARRPRSPRVARETTSV